MFNLFQETQQFIDLNVFKSMGQKINEIYNMQPESGVSYT